MRVMHELVKTMEVPVERLRFDPDPWAITCDCVQCRAARQRAKLQRLVTDLNAEESTAASSSPWPQPPLEVFRETAERQEALATDAGIPAGVPAQIGTDEKAAKPVVEPLAAVPELPRWFRGLVRACAWLLAGMHWVVVRKIVLSRPRLRVVRED